MPTLRVTASLGRSRQAFELDAEVITVGRAPDSVLVLPMAWVGERHLLITDAPLADGSPGLHIALASELQRATLDGREIPAEGVTVAAGSAFLIDIPSPTGAALRLDAGPVVPVAAARPPKRFRGDLLAGGIVLAGVVTLIVVLTAPRSAPAPVATEPPPAQPTAVDAREAEARRHLDDAALAFSAGDLPGARLAIQRAAADGAQGPVLEALQVAVRNEQLRREAATRPTTAPTASVPTAPELVEFEGRRVTPGERERLLVEREARRREQDRERQRAGEAQQRRLDEEVRRVVERARADQQAGKDAKLTPAGRSALKAAQSAVRARLELGAETDVQFPADDDDRVVVVYDAPSGTFLVRGYLDVWNQNRNPLRTFYLARLKPAGPDDFTVVTLNLLN